MKIQWYDRDAYSTGKTRHAYVATLFEGEPSSQSLRKFIGWLDQFFVGAEGADLQIEFRGRGDEYDSGVDMRIYAERAETDQEYESRAAREKAKSERAKENRAKRATVKEQREREQYERLKAKYEKGQTDVR